MICLRVCVCACVCGGGGVRIRPRPDKNPKISEKIPILCTFISANMNSEAERLF